MKISEWTTIIYKKEFTTNNGEKIVKHSASISKKTNDKYESGYIECYFKKGEEIDDKQMIKVNNGWLSFYKTKEGKTVPTIFISEFEKVNKKDTEEVKAPWEI